MKFKLDENIPVEACNLLKDKKHDAKSVIEEGLKSASDQKIFRKCVQERRCIITMDLDFSDIRSYPPETHYGIIVIRGEGMTKYDILDQIRNLIEIFEKENPKKSLWIIEKERVRIRKKEG